MTQFGFSRMSGDSLPDHEHDDSGQGGVDLNPNTIGSSNALSSLTVHDITQVSGTASLQEVIAASYLMTPADAVSVAANKNNWDVDGGFNWPLLTPRWDVRVQAGTFNITGIVAPLSITNPLIYFTTVGMGGTLSVGNLILKHNSGSSTAANRIYTPNGEDLFIPPFGGWLMNYNDTVDRWVILAYSGVPSATLRGPVILNTTITPTIAANQNNWAPTGLATCTSIVVDCSAAGRTITGFDATGFVEGQIFNIMPTNAGAGGVTLSHNSGSSSSGNRITGPNNANVTLQGGGIQIQYSTARSTVAPFTCIGGAA